MLAKINITSEQIALWIRIHFKKILIIFSSFVLLGIAFIGWVEWQKKQERTIQDSLYKFQQALNTLEKKKIKKTEQKKTFVMTEELESKALLYERAIKKYPKSKIAVVSAIDLADFYYRHSEIKRAIDLLSAFAYPERASSTYHLLSFQLAGYYMDEEKCEKALTLLKKLNLNKKAVAFHLESDLRQALCLEHLNRYGQALSKYEIISNQDSEGYIGRLARDYKRLLMLKQNLKIKK